MGEERDDAGDALLNLGGAVVDAVGGDKDLTHTDDAGSHYNEHKEHQRPAVDTVVETYLLVEEFGINWH